MKNFSKILVPVDFSEGSKHAVRCAISLAHNFHSEVTLFHVLEIGTYGMYGPESFWTNENLELIQKAADLEMEKFVGSLRGEGPFGVQMEASPKQPADVICEKAQALGTDLIAMSTHGRSGLNHLLLGSVTERVIRRAPCPVLTFRIPCDPS